MECDTNFPCDIEELVDPKNNFGGSVDDFTKSQAFCTVRLKQRPKKVKLAKQSLNYNCSLLEHLSTPKIEGNSANFKSNYVPSYSEDKSSQERDFGEVSSVPGTEKIFVKTWGCTHNNSDSEYMAGLLSSYGYLIVENPVEADVWLLNSCTVKSPAEDHLRNEIKKGKELGKMIVIAGCVSQAAPRSSFLKGLSIIGVQQIDRVVEVVEQTLRGNSVRLLGSRRENGRRLGGAALSLPKIRKNPLIEIIPINTGCLNQCTYCKTKHSRGDLGSYSIEEIVIRAKEAISEGVVEIWLTSEDTGAYGRDIGTTLPDLLQELLKVIPGHCMLRIGMTNPPYILDHLEAMAEILNAPQVYSFLHIPVQSGSDAVLLDMKREYSIAEFEHVVDYLKEKVPGITIATDVICGFPTETPEDFTCTMALCHKYCFSSLFINQFYPRPGTPAARMPRIPTQEVKQRSRELSEFFQSYHPYKDREGAVYRVLITDVAHDKMHLVGHNKFYEQVLVLKEDALMGQMVDVEIVSTGKHYMMGIPVRSSQGIGKIEYQPSAGPAETLCFKHYNAKEIILGKTMEEWLRFSVVYWHSFRGTGTDPFGGPTIKRSWEEGSDALEIARNRLRAAFEFFTKLGNKYYAFHDRDIAPEGETLEETNKYLDEVTDVALELQKQTGVKLLWATCNLFSHPWYMNGAATNPDAHVVAFAGAQVKKGLEIAHKLGAENFVFWGGREGYQSLLNTNLRTELDHYASFLKMAANFKKKIGFTGQLLIEPKPKEPTKHQYDYDAMTVMGFLKTYGLEGDFKLNVEPNHTTLAGHGYEHDIAVAASYKMLGSIDANTGSPDLGWDTDQFPMDIKNATLIMKIILEQGGLSPGGLNFDAKVRRESVEPKDLFIAHIGAMDALARGLKNAAKIVQDGILSQHLKERYNSFTNTIGQKIEKDEATLEDCEAFIASKGNPSLISGQQEHLEAILNHYI